MKTRVELDSQVVAFVKSLSPEPRRRVRIGIRGLEQQKGDLKQLDSELAGYVRLRIGNYRIIIRFHSYQGKRVARCIFAEHRSVVYELFAEILRGEK